VYGYKSRRAMDNYAPAKGFYDPGLFFDDNGKQYVAQGYNKISITEVDSNLVAIGPDRLFIPVISGEGWREHMYIKLTAFITCTALMGDVMVYR